MSNQERTAKMTDADLIVIAGKQTTKAKRSNRAQVAAEELVIRGYMQLKRTGRWMKRGSYNL